MYSFNCVDTVLDKLKECSKTSPSINSRLEDLANNPMAKAIPTNIESIGNYYVNAGRYCILIDVDEEKQEVTILSVVLSPYLDKVLKGKIQP